MGISTDLHSLALTLHNTYLKYKTLINASKTMQGLQTSQEWADHLDEHGVECWAPDFVDLVNVFIAKSQFYSSWKGLFSRAQNYSQMKGGLSSAPPIPAGIRSFRWNSGGFRNLHRNVPRNGLPRNGPEWSSPESARIIDLFVIYLDRKSVV